MDHEIDTTFALQNFCIEKSQMYSQNVTFQAEISGNHILGQPHAQLEVEGLRALGKGLTGPKNSAGYALFKHSTCQPSSLPEAPDKDQRVVRGFQSRCQGPFQTTAKVLGDIFR